MNGLRCYPIVVTDQSSEKEIRRGLIDVRCSRWNLGLVHAYFERIEEQRLAIKTDIGEKIFSTAYQNDDRVHGLQGIASTLH